MGFRTRVRKAHRIPVLEINGDFVGENAAKAAAILDEMRSSSDGAIAVDLSGMHFIDSVGLGVFVYCWRLLENQRRDMFFIKPNGFVLTMLRNTSLDKVFKVVENLT